MFRGDRLKEQRKAKGYTQTELGNIMNVGKAAICCYEKNLRNPTLQTVVTMVEIFQKPADYFLGTDEFIKKIKKR